MENKNIIIIIIAALCLTIMACKYETDTCHRTLYIKNISNKDIYWMQFSSDTILDRAYKAIYKLKKSETYGTRPSLDCIEVTLDQGQRTYLTLLDAAVVESTPWDTICKKDMVLKRYKLSVADLMRMDFTVTYP